VNPQHQRAHNNLALVQVRNDRLEDAVAEFRKGGSDPAQARSNLAFALTMERRWDAARAEYQRVLDLDPSSQVAKARLGQLNALLAKLEPKRIGGTSGPQVLTTSATTSRPRPAVSVVTPPQSVRFPASRDSALLRASRAIPPPRRAAGLRPVVSPPAAPRDTRIDSWWVDESPSGASSQR
jgi:hypothetical protein